MIFPKTTPEVAEIMKIASANRVFVTPRGSGSGLSAAALAKEGGVMICFTMMNRILEINTANRYAVVEPGVIISEFQKELDKFNLFYPPDPGSAHRGDDGRSGDDECRRDAGGEIRGHAGSTSWAWKSSFPRAP